jgi:tetratricopeptide (TPR) repeat protein
MATLRITPRILAEGTQHLTLELLDEDKPALHGGVKVRFALDAQQLESLRWYLEDFLTSTHLPAEIYAARVNYELPDWGTTLFRAIFRTKGGRPIWAAIRDRLDEIRVELAVDPGQIEVPWELMRESRKREPLALRVRSLVYVPKETEPPPTREPAASGEPLRLLLCIARPKGQADISFRSVAVRLMHGLEHELHDRIRVDLVRPSTFEQFQQQLLDARAADRPYSLVHFDGHGVFDESTSRPAAHRRGYLVFEDGRGGEEYVDGATLGSVLIEAGVSVVVLNACRSARAAQAEPEPAPAGDQARPFGSLAAELSSAGVEGVVAMRYNLYLATAVRFVETLYRQLVVGRSLGESVAVARAKLAHDLRREVNFREYELSDWLVPVVTERRPVFISAPAVDPGQYTTVSHAAPPILDPELPRRPSAGFIGRDESLLELDRSLQSHRMVLLQGGVGQGKTVVAAEFARWLRDTGGTRGCVLYTSLRNYGSAEQLLDDAAARAPSVAGDTDCRERLKRIGLWIVDDADAIEEDPGYEMVEWSEESRTLLSERIHELAAAGVRFLLTARRNTGTLATLCTDQVQLGPLSMEDRIELTRALVRHIPAAMKPPEWAPLLHFCGGNPALLEGLVARVLERRSAFAEAVAAVVEEARARPGHTEDEGVRRDLSQLDPLIAAFAELPEVDRRRLILLHLFQGAAESRLLWWMGHADNVAAVPDLRDVSMEEVEALLQRGAAADLLESLGGGFYVPHPALTVLLSENFARMYPEEPPVYNRALHSYAEAIGQLGLSLHQQAKTDSRNPQAILRFHVQNLRHAHQICLSYLTGATEAPHRESWLQILVGVMQGLQVLFAADVRDWQPLVDAAVPAVTNDEGNGPRTGAEYAWTIISGYRVRIAREFGHLDEALELHRAILTFDLARAAPLFKKPAELLTREERQVVADFAYSLHERGQLQRRLEDPACVEAYTHALAILKRLGDGPGVSTCAFNLGIAYLELQRISDLQSAEVWFNASLEACPPDDWISRAMCFAQLALIERERLHDARRRGDAAAANLRLNHAFDLATRALRLTPADAPSYALRHEHLADLWLEAGKLEQALKSYHEALNAYKNSGDPAQGASACLKLARALFDAGRHFEARDYATEAVVGYHFAHAEAAEEEARALFLEIDAIIRPEAYPPGDRTTTA